MTFGLIVLFSLLASIGSVGLTGLFLVFRVKPDSRLISGAVAYSIGALLGAAFLGIIPEAQLLLPDTRVFPTILSGLILFFALEKLAIWRHCHEESCQVHTRAGSMILIGDSLHNLVDGIAIASAFAGSRDLGIATSIAAIAHEVPQELGDFAILLDSGYSRRLAFFYNALSSLTTLLGAVGGYFLMPLLRPLVPYFLLVSAASFIYIALADLAPGRRVSGGVQSLAWELPLIVVGVATIALL